VETGDMGEAVYALCIIHYFSRKKMAWLKNQPPAAAPSVTRDFGLHS